MANVRDNQQLQSTDEGPRQECNAESHDATAVKMKRVSFLSLFRFATWWDVFLIVAGCLGAVCHGAAWPAFTVLFGSVFDDLGISLWYGDKQAFRDELYVLISYFIYLAIAAMVANLVEMSLIPIAAARQTRRIRRAFLDAALMYEMSFFDREGCTGYLLHTLNGNVEVVQKGMAQHFGTAARHLSTAAVCFGLAFWQGWDVTLLMLAVVPIMAAMNYVGFRMMEKHSKNMAAIYAKANGVAIESLSNIRTIAAYTIENALVNRYSSLLERPMRKGIREGFYSGFLFGFANLSIFSAYALAMWYGGERIINGSYTPGNIITIIGLALLGGSTAGQVLRSMIQLNKSMLAAQEVWKVIDNSPVSGMKTEATPASSAGSEAADEGPGIRISNVEGSICFHGVKFEYPGRKGILVFKGLDLSIPAGARVALVGPTGCGKSTVINMILRLYHPDAGQVTLDDVDLRLLDVKWLRSIIGLVSQEPVLLATDIRSNITLGRPCTEVEVHEAAKAANAAEFINALPQGFDTDVGEAGMQLSGGQKQRIAIARAILHSPKILLLDEATSALDSANEKVVQETLDSLMERRTTVTVAHRLSTIREADCIMVMSGGELVQSGTHKQLARDPEGIYASMLSHSQGDGRLPGNSTEDGTGRDRDDSGEVVLMKDEDASGSSSSKSCSSDSPIPVPDESLGITAAAQAGTLPIPQGKGTDTIVPAPGAAVQQDCSLELVIESVPAGDNSDDEASIKAPSPTARLWQMSKPHMPVGIIGITAAAAYGAVLPLFGFFLGHIIADLYLQDEDLMRSRVQFWCIFFVCLGAGAFLVQLVSNVSLTYVGQKLAREVRVVLFGAMLKQEIGWFDAKENASGILASFLENETAHLRGAVADAVGQLSQNFLGIALALVLAFMSGWKLALVVLATMPLLVLVVYIQTSMMTSLSLKVSRLSEAANSIATDGIRNPRMVAAFNLQQLYGNTYSQALKKPARKMSRLAVYTGIGFGILVFLQMAIISLVFWYGGSMVLDGEMQLEQLLIVFLSVWMAVFGLMMGQMVFPDVAQANAAVQKVFGIVDRTPKIPGKEMASGAGGCPELSPLLEPSAAGGGAVVAFEEVHFSYPERPTVKVLCGLTLHVQSGETMALCGESGCGKSTAISLLERFYDPSAGSVKIDGVDIRNLRVCKLRQQIGLVSQEPVLFEGSVHDNIAFGKPDATEEEIQAAVESACLIEFVTSLPDKGETRISKTELSGGQKQRIAIARAILRNPRLLLLDEATSALDTRTEAEIQETLNTFMKGRTAVVVAHRLATVRNADKVAVLCDGRVAESGSHANLMALRGRYHALVQLQSHGAFEQLQ